MGLVLEFLLYLSLSAVVVMPILAALAFYDWEILEIDEGETTKAGLILLAVGGVRK